MHVGAAETGAQRGQWPARGHRARVCVWLQNLGSSQHAGLPPSSTGNRMPPWTSPTWAPVNLHTMGL